MFIHFSVQVQRNILRQNSPGESIELISSAALHFAGRLFHAEDIRDQFCDLAGVQSALLHICQRSCRFIDARGIFSVVFFRVDLPLKGETRGGAAGLNARNTDIERRKLHVCTLGEHIERRFGA